MFYFSRTKKSGPLTNTVLVVHVDPQLTLSVYTYIDRQRERQERKKEREREIGRDGERETEREKEKMLRERGR